MNVRAFRMAVASLLLAALAAPGCGKVDPLGPSDETNEVVDGINALIVEPPRLEFAHLVGSSPCPQLVGRITIRNVGFSDKAVEVEALSPLQADKFRFTVRGGESVEVLVYFICSTDRSFEAPVKVYFGDEVVRQVNVRGTVGTL